MKKHTSDKQKSNYCPLIKKKCKKRKCALYCGTYDECAFVSGITSISDLFVHLEDGSIDVNIVGACYEDD